MWPSASPPTATTSVKFDYATIDNAVVGSPAPGSLGTTSLTFGGLTVSGFAGASTPTDLSYDQYGGFAGLGAFGASSALSTLNNEWMRFDLADRARTFAISLADFNQYDFLGTYTERLELKFFNDGTQVGSTMLKLGCVLDAPLASFASIDPGSVFNRIEVTPVMAIDALSNEWHTDFLVSEIKACADGVTPC